jgi:Rad3-related DNA helicase
MNESVRVLTKTKSLQFQYEEYDFKVLLGLNNYDCALFEHFDGSYCAFPESMYDCPVAKECPYLIQRGRVRGHYRQSLSYAYFLSAGWPKSQSVDYLYCDEAHELPKIVMDYASLKWTLDTLRWLKLPQWPTEFKINSDVYKKRKICSWLYTCADKLSNQINELDYLVELEPKIAKKIRLLQSEQSALRRIADNLYTNYGMYILHVTDEELSIVPLSAKNDFLRLFTDKDNKYQMVLTSATIGNPNAFADALGIPDFVFRETPSNFPPEDMPVYVPHDAPKMNYKSGESAKQKQAILIHGLLDDHNPNWNGLIHTSSKVQTYDLAERLSRLGYEDRVWVASEHVGTEARMLEWMERLRSVPNTINISWSSHEGVDAGFATHIG